MPPAGRHWSGDVLPSDLVFESTAGYNKCMPAFTVWLFGDRTTPARQAGATTQFARLGVATALAASVSFFLVSALLLTRRLTGHFTAELSVLPFLPVSALVLAAVAAPRLVGAWLTVPRGNGALRAVLLVLPAMAIFMLGAALSHLTAPFWPLVMLWLAILAEEGACWVLYFRGRIGHRRPRTIATHPPAAAPQPQQQPIDVIQQRLAEPQLETNDESIPENVVQQLTRVREENGRESLHGILRGSFAAGERTQNLHVAFCPPLAGVPQFSFEQVDGPPASIKAAQVESFGARLEVRLDAALDEPADVLVEFSCQELES